VKSASSRVVGLVAAVLVLVLGCGTPMTSSASPSHTVTTTYSPWSSGGALKPSVRVAKTVTGSCWTGSIAVDAGNAYRCTSASYIYDPCFASPARHAGTVVCAINPWSDVVLMNLSSALPHLVKHQRNPLLVWAERLGNGERCVIDTGTGVSVAGATLNYYCSPGAGWASVPDLSTSLWSTSYAATNHARSLRQVPVLVAWY